MRQKADLAEVLGVPETAVRVVAEDVGGNFGTRNSFYPEFALVAWAARRLGRPVKWTCERREAFLTDYQARDLVSAMELALDADGRFLALRGANTSNVGAHTVTFVPLNKGRELATTVYRVPAAAVRGRAVLSNTSPLAAYRSAGRPQVMFVMERLIDLAARRHGFDRLALRRRNLVPAAAMPYTNPFGIVYDSGDYVAVQDRAVALADWAGFEARRREARARGRYRGIGLANYIEIATGAPRERAHITVRPEGRIDVVIGTLAAGQGHETSFAQLVVEWLGVALDQVRLISGDTDRVAVGGGSHSGRSMRLGGVVMAKAADQIVEKGARLAAWRLESAVADLEFAGGQFRVRGTDRAIGLFEVAAAAARPDAPEDLRGPLDGACDETVSTPSFPYGCAVCEVEVDPETGVVEVVRYTSVDDVGRAINPLIVDGQTHGGIVQGLGQALWEHCRYDAESGQLQSATFMEYAMPRADLLPSFTTEISEVPSTSNPLGLRGGGEGGTTPALGAAVNAIVDALADAGRGAPRDAGHARARLGRDPGGSARPGRPASRAAGARARPPDAGCSTGSRAGRRRRPAAARRSARRARPPADRRGRRAGRRRPAARRIAGRRAGRPRRARPRSSAAGAPRDPRPGSAVKAFSIASSTCSPVRTLPSTM